MVRFCVLVGVGIAPVSKKTAVKLTFLIVYLHPCYLPNLRLSPPQTHEGLQDRLDHFHIHCEETEKKGKNYHQNNFLHCVRHFTLAVTVFNRGRLKRGSRQLKSSRVGQ